MENINTYKIITKAHIYEQYMIKASSEEEAKQVFNDQGWDEESKVLTIENEEIISIYNEGVLKCL